MKIASAFLVVTGILGALAAPTVGQVPPSAGTVKNVSRTTKAVNYRRAGGTTMINFQGTELMQVASGEAKVQNKGNRIEIEAKFMGLDDATKFGLEYLTYVLWAISPDGRPVNLGELTLDHYGKGSSSAIKTTSEIQTFGMIVTAEPYYAVTQPSDVVVAENFLRNDTSGTIEQVDAKFELLQRGQGAQLAQVIHSQQHQRLADRIHLLRQGVVAGVDAAQDPVRHRQVL